MMKSPICWPLLSLLQVAVIPRDSSAHAFTPKFTTSSPTVNHTTSYNMIKGIIHLTTTFTWLQNNMPSFQQFNETIDNLEKNIESLPSDEEGDRSKMLELLYRSNDRFNEARTVLNVTAKQLISYCDDLNNLIDDNNHSGELLKYTVSEYVRYTGVINVHLKDVLEMLMEIKDILTDLKELVKGFNVTPSSEEEKIEKRFNIKDDIFQIFVSDRKEALEEMSSALEFMLTLAQIPTVTNTRVELPEYIRNENPAIKYYNAPNPAEETEAVFLRNNPEIKYVPQVYSDIKNIRVELPEYIRNENPAVKYYNTPNSAEETEAVFLGNNPKIEYVPQVYSDIKINENPTNKIEESISALLSQVAKINKYIVEESEMITQQQISLDVSILDHEDISMEDIKYKFKSLKDSIIALRNACSLYSSN